MRIITARYQELFFLTNALEKDIYFTFIPIFLLYLLKKKSLATKLKVLLYNDRPIPLYNHSRILSR